MNQSWGFRRGGGRLQRGYLETSFGHPFARRKAPAMMMPDHLPCVHSFLRPARFRPVVQAFVLRLMLTFCCRFGRMTAAQAATLPAADPRHPAAIGRFLGRKRWAEGDWMKPLRTRWLRQEALKGGRFFFLLDQTCSSRQGSKTPNTFSTGNRSRRPRKGRRYSNKKNARKRCHAFVCGLLLMPSGRRIPYRKSYYTQEYAAHKQRPFRTQAELGAALIDELDLPQGVEVVVLGDTAYEAKVVQQACLRKGFTWVAPCNAERVLEGPKPRPQVRSLLEQISAKRFVAVQVRPATDLYALQRRWSVCRRDRQNSGRTYWVCKQRQLIRSVGEVSVFVSTTKKPQPGQPLHEPKILLSNDLNLSPREAVLRYTLRWQVELFFKEMKSVLGMVDYRVRDFTRVERWVDLALMTFLYLEWYRDKQRRCATDEKMRSWWEAQRAAGLCRAVRQEAQARERRWLAQRLRTPGGCTRLRRLLQAACPPEKGGQSAGPPIKRRA
jgi:hypothetical protein